MSGATSTMSSHNMSCDLSNKILFKSRGYMFKTYCMILIECESYYPKQAAGMVYFAVFEII